MQDDKVAIDRILLKSKRFKYNLCKYHKTNFQIFNLILFVHWKKWRLSTDSSVEYTIANQFII